MTTGREWMGPGGPRGLQIPSSGAFTVRGGFDSHTFPPDSAGRRPPSGGGASPGRSAALILNPTAGDPRRPLRAVAAAALLRRAGLAVETLRTTRPGEATELAARAAERHPVVAAAGGDGTVHEVAVGLLGSRAALAVLPAGSGNDFATGLGLHSAAAGAAAAGAGHVRRVDVGRFDGRPFVNTVGLFLSGLVSLRAAALWRRCGRWRYVLASLRSLPAYRGQPGSWRLEGEPEARGGRWLLAEIANGPQAGGGFRLAPDADFGDGLLDFCLVRPLGLVALARVFPAAARGARIEHPGVERPRSTGGAIRLEEATAMHLDGEPEILPAGEYRIALEAGRLPVLAPPPDGAPRGGS